MKNFANLIQVTDSILKSLSKDPSQFPNEVINWSDLYCKVAEWYRNSDGHDGYRVYIEEASPNSSKFARVVHDRLLLEGYGDVDVVVEWRAISIIGGVD